ncbi:uncharacterized protein N7477_007503 [Penicillium maclennaniae]|uniref:uncharacterized protein n=1 Tax=Penicillium maclennaniae TaxID=1343394 RepID=UPI002540BA24|nr:uncharacterized protein N7477_007503 [Penicillium maclennaniae]KAJ5665055.1 hypothetical protein N7477_007503 [Penicillium maclennaniae]
MFPSYSKKKRLPPGRTLLAIYLFNLQLLQDLPLQIGHVKLIGPASSIPFRLSIIDIFKHLSNLVRVFPVDDDGGEQIADVDVGLVCIFDGFEVLDEQAHLFRGEADGKSLAFGTLKDSLCTSSDRLLHW